MNSPAPRFLFLLCLLMALHAVTAGQTAAPESCPVTTPAAQPFVPPDPFSRQSVRKAFWYGTDSLWTSLPVNGVLALQRENPPVEMRLLRTVSLWRQSFWDADSKASLSVTATRLDAASDPVKAGHPFGGWLEQEQTVSVNIRFPSPGCWQITAREHDRQLTFTTWIIE